MRYRLRATRYDGRKTVELLDARVADEDDAYALLVVVEDWDGADWQLTYDDGTVIAESEFWGTYTS